MEANKRGIWAVHSLVTDLAKQAADTIQPVLDHTLALRECEGCAKSWPAASMPVLLRLAGECSYSRFSPPLVAGLEPASSVLYHTLRLSRSALTCVVRVRNFPAHSRHYSA